MQCRVTWLFLTCEEDKPSQASVSHQKSFDLRKQAESKEYLTNRYLNSTEASFAYSIQEFTEFVNCVIDNERARQ
jgi:hypothetical protein